MSHARAKRRLMQWERYHVRWPSSGAWCTGGISRHHNGHLKALDRVSFCGRYAPIGIREPWTLRAEKVGT